jgi:multimeric flavodoxin WrbA
MTDQMLKILGICGSHRTEKNTYFALSRCLDGIAALGIPVETEIVDLSRLHIEDCKGCHVCFLQARGASFCPVIHDDMTSIYRKLVEADGIIAASPVHWWSSTAKMRRFIDRTNAFCGAANTEYAGALYNKVGGVVTVSYDVHGGSEVAATHLATWMLAENMLVVGTQGAHIAGTAACNLSFPTAMPDSVKSDHHGMKSIYEVGRRVAETAWILKIGRKHLGSGGADPACAHADRGSGCVGAEPGDEPLIDWDKFFRYENSFPKEHVGIEGRLATARRAFEKFIDEMSHRKKSEGNTWGVFGDREGFVSDWIEKRGLVLLSDKALYDLCPEYYHFYLKSDQPEESWSTC